MSFLRGGTRYDVRRYPSASSDELDEEGSVELAKQLASSLDCD